MSDWPHNNPSPIWRIGRLEVNTRLSARPATAAPCGQRRSDPPDPRSTVQVAQVKRLVVRAGFFHVTVSSDPLPTRCGADTLGGSVGEFSHAGGKCAARVARPGLYQRVLEEQCRVG